MTLKPAECLCLKPEAAFIWLSCLILPKWSLKCDDKPKFFNELGQSHRAEGYEPETHQTVLLSVLTTASSFMLTFFVRVPGTLIRPAKRYLRKKSLFKKKTRLKSVRVKSVIYKKNRDPCKIEVL